MTDAITDTHADDDPSHSSSSADDATASAQGAGARPGDVDPASPATTGSLQPPEGYEAADGLPAAADGQVDRLADGQPGEADGQPGEGGISLRRVKGWISGLGNRILAAQVESYITFFVVTICAGFVLVQLGGGNIIADNTPAGGDMGAHVWGPAFMRDHLLTKGRLTGWTNDWYAGFPAYQFYMVLPSLAIALLSLVIPYGIAFKIVAVSGLVTMPIAAWGCAKLSDLPFPAPPLFAVAGTVFLFDRSFSILGGNIPSTLAGEFAFSISLSLALLFLGMFSRALRTGQGKHRGWAAILLALCGLCHLIPFIFALIGSVLFLLVMPGLTSWTRERVGGLMGIGLAGGLWYLANPAKGYDTPDGFGFLEPFVKPGDGMQTVLTVLAIVVGVASAAALVFTIAVAGRHLLYVWFPVLAIGGLLSAWWTVPFYLNHKYMNDMGWEKKDDVLNMLFQRSKLDPQLVDSPPIKAMLLLGAAGALLSLIWWRRGGLFWLLTAATFGVMYVHMPEIRLWNARLLPFYYLALYFLAAVGIAEVSRLVATLFARDVNRPIRTVMGVTAVAGLLGLLVVALPLRVWLPFAHLDKETNTYRWLFWENSEPSFVSSWANWNFTGYEGKPAYPEYHDIVAKMADIGEKRGCGRAMWEHEEQHDRYGTPMALMLLPFWTDGCIGSMEGLYFEASSTTPYHFINQDELSRGPSNAQRDLPYRSGPPTKEDFDLGIEHLKLLGVRYYMAISEGPGGMIEMARQNKNLTEIDGSGPWRVFEINNGSDLVEPLKFEPAVVELNDPTQPLSQDLLSVQNADGTPKVKTGSPWQFMAMDWYQDQTAWDTYLAADGPEGWQRINRGDKPKLKAEKPIQVTNISTGDDSISFDVSEAGVPVVVKTSYFPNWKVSGAEGPWRVAPNLMVVVPNSSHVEMHFGYTRVDYLAWLLTLLGLVGVVWMFRSKPVKVPDPSDPNAQIYPSDVPSTRLDPTAAAVPAAATAPGHLVYDPSTGALVMPPAGPPSPWTPNEPVADRPAPVEHELWAPPLSTPPEARPESAPTPPSAGPAPSERPTDPPGYAAPDDHDG